MRNEAEYAILRDYSERHHIASLSDFRLVIEHLGLERDRDPMVPADQTWVEGIVRGRGHSDVHCVARMLRGDDL